MDSSSKGFNRLGRGGLCEAQAATEAFVLPDLGMYLVLGKKLARELVAERAQASSGGTFRVLIGWPDGTTVIWPTSNSAKIVPLELANAYRAYHDWCDELEAAGGRIPDSAGGHMWAVQPNTGERSQ